MDVSCSQGESEHILLLFLHGIGRNSNIMHLLPSQDRISELPDDILFGCLSLLEMKNAAQTSIISRRWRHLWTHWTHLDFDPKKMFSEDLIWWSPTEYARVAAYRYIAWVNQVVSVHRGSSIDILRVCVRYFSEDATHLDEWVKFALSRRVKELVLDLFGVGYLCGGRSQKGYPLGFEILKHSPCCTGITALKSLHLSYVSVSGRFLEFLLLCCPDLERLYVENSAQLTHFRVKSAKLKHLTIHQGFFPLEELEIDARNLSYFRYLNRKHDDSIVFKNLPMLVEMDFAGSSCRCPFPIFQHISLWAIHLCKLSLEIDIMIEFCSVLEIPDGVIPMFPNVKHFTCSCDSSPFECILLLKRFVEACPALQVFKLQVQFLGDGEEAEELQGIDVEDVNVDVEASEVLERRVGFNYDNNLDNPRTRSEVKDECKHRHRNLRILELVGFWGVRADVKFALSVESYASSLDTIICDTLGTRYTGRLSFFGSEDVVREYDVAKRRARKLAKIVAPKVKFLPRYTNLNDWLAHFVACSLPTL